MQLISLCLFTILLGYSLVIAAPVQQTTPMTEEIKHQKAHAIANRLLKELVGEQQQQLQQEPVAQPQEESQKKEEIKTEQKPTVEKVESHIQSGNNDVDEEEEFESRPTLEDLVELYGDRYADLLDDEEPSSELYEDDEYLLPVDTEDLLRYLNEQDESDESAVPVIHTPIMDDSIMTAEDHQRRRRSIY